MVKMKFKDLLAIACIIVIIPSLWVSQGLGAIELPEAVVGATILQWGLILQYYFRKKSNGEG